MSNVIVLYTYNFISKRVQMLKWNFVSFEIEHHPQPIYHCLLFLYVCFHWFCCFWAEKAIRSYWIDKIRSECGKEMGKWTLVKWNLKEEATAKWSHFVLPSTALHLQTYTIHFRSFLHRWCWCGWHLWIDKIRFVAINEDNFISSELFVFVFLGLCGVVV